MKLDEERLSGRIAICNNAIARLTLLPDPSLQAVVDDLVALRDDLKAQLDDFSRSDG